MYTAQLSSEVYVDLAGRIRTEREARQMSQEALARQAGMSLRALNSLERGKAVNPHYSTLAGIADAFGMSVGELLEEPSPVPLDEVPEAGRSEDQAPEETPKELSLLDDPQIVEWLRKQDLTWGTMTSAEFEKHVHGLHLEEVDEDGRPVTVMELGRALGDEKDAALDLLWTKSKYRSLGGLLSVDKNAPVAEQKNQRRDQLSKLRMQLGRRYRRRLYALKRYAEFLTELLAAQEKERKAAFRKILDNAA